MSLLGRLFGKQEKSDLEIYKETRAKQLAREAVLSSNDSYDTSFAFGDNKDIIFKKTRDDEYVFLDYFHDGLLYGSELCFFDADNKKNYAIHRHTFQLCMDLYEKTEDSIDKIRFIMDLDKEKDANEDSKYFDANIILNKIMLQLSSFPNTKQLNIIRLMAENKTFMDSLLNFIKKEDTPLPAGLCVTCVDYMIYNGEVTKAIDYLVPLIHRAKDINEDMSTINIYLRSVRDKLDADDKRVYDSYYTSFENELRQKRCAYFLDGINTENDDYEELDSDTAAAIDEIVDLSSPNPGQALEKWIALIKQHEAELKQEDQFSSEDISARWHKIIFDDLSDRIDKKYGYHRGIMLMAREFLNHKEWFSYLKYDTQNAFFLAQLAAALMAHTKYEKTIIDLSAVLKNEWNNEELWSEYVDGFRYMVYDNIYVFKDQLDSLSFSYVGNEDKLSSIEQV